MSVNISDGINVINDRVKALDIKHYANDSLAEYLNENDREKLKQNVEKKAQALLDSLLIDTDSDHNTKDTAKRMAKMYIDEIFHGRYHACPKLTTFPNVEQLDNIFTLGPISVRSTCSHHFAPIIGEVWVGVLPGEKLFGISKFSRLIHWFMSRPHIQEEAIVKLAKLIEEKLAPKGLAIILKAEHMCMTWRGVKEHDTSMINTLFCGKLKTDKGLREEFLLMAQAQGFK